MSKERRLRLCGCARLPAKYGDFRIRVGCMIRAHFLSPDDRADLIALARNGSAAHRLARRANALVLLDDGWSCENVARALLLDDDTIRGWHGLFVAEGLEGLARFEAGGSACQGSSEQQEKLKAWVAAALPRTTRQIGAWIEKEFGVVYEGRSGLIALLHRLGLEYHKPSIIPRKLDKEKQKAFIESYDNLLNSLADNEAVLFADAAHPTHAARPAGCWAPSQEKLAIEQTSGRQRIDIHGAIDLETGQTRMIEALTIDAASTIRLLESIEALNPMLALIHVFLDNAKYHHARIVRAWLVQRGRRRKLHCIPAYCPHLNPIERLSQPFPHNPGVVIFRIVEKNMDERQHRIERLDRFEQPDRRGGVDGQRLNHPGLPGLQVDRAMDVDALASAGLLDRQVVLFGRPAADRLCGMGRMHSIREQHGLVVAQGIHQLFIARDESLLLFFVQLARDDGWLVIFELQTMQQRDQSRAAGVDEAEFLLDPGADLARRAWQHRPDPGFQLGLVLAIQLAGAAARLETRQPFEAVLDKQAVPFADCIVVQKQGRGDLFAAPAIVQKHQRIGAPRQPMRRRSVTRQE